MTDDGNTLWYSGNDTIHEHRISFIVKKELVKSVMDIKQISRRIILLRISASPMNLCVVQVYALTNSYDDDKVVEFYEVLKHLTNITQNKSIQIIENKKEISVKDDSEILNRWSEYFKDLYNYHIIPDRNLLNNR